MQFIIICKYLILYINLMYVTYITSVYVCVCISLHDLRSTTYFYSIFTSVILFMVIQSMVLMSDRASL